MWTKALDLRRNPYNKSYGAEGTITLEPDGTLNFYYGPTGSNAQPYTSAAMNIAVTAKTWIHLAVVRDFTAKTVTWYRNGKPTTPVPLPYPTGSTSSLPLIIGNGYTNPFIGQLDDVGVWPRALSPQEIASLYNATAAGR
jgi:hypothetical protein